MNLHFESASPRALTAFKTPLDLFNKAIQGVIEFVKRAGEEFKSFAKSIQEKFNLPSLDEIKQSLKDFLVLIKTTSDF